MAFINKTIPKMGMPQAMRRGYVGPLDVSSLYYSYEAMAEYAANDAVAYVGQILTLVDEANSNKVTAYIIADEAGALKEVGSATLGDNKTIVLNDENGTLGLNNWNTKYWRRGDKELGEEDYVEQIVDETHPWKAGLQPRVYFNGSTYELAWYEPSTTSIEDVSNIVVDVQTAVTGLTNAIGTIEDAAGADTVYGALNKVKEDNVANAEEIERISAAYLPLTGGALTGVLTLEDGHKAASEHVVDTKIATALESVGTLKRVIVDVLPDVEEADPNVIYMVAAKTSTEQNIYNEYMLIENDFEIIGDTYVDLSDYVQKVEGAVENNLAALNANGALIDAGIALQDVADHLADEVIHITSDERTAWNEGAALAATNAQAIENLVKISQDDANKLAALPAITEIGVNLELVDGVLSAVAEQYELPAASTESLGGVKVGAGLAIDNEGVLSLPIVEANGLTLSADGLKLASANETAAGAMPAEMFVKLNNLPANAQANIIEGAVLGANAVPALVNEHKQLMLPFATATNPGVVVSSEDDNGISVNAATGKMTVNNISVDKLYVPDNVEFILDGGNSK